MSGPVSFLRAASRNTVTRKNDIEQIKQKQVYCGENKEVRLTFTS